MKNVMSSIKKRTGILINCYSKLKKVQENKNRKGLICDSACGSLEINAMGLKRNGEEQNQGVKKRCCSTTLGLEEGKKLLTDGDELGIQTEGIGEMSLKIW